MLSSPEVQALYDDDNELLERWRRWGN
jgi:hypothetical protein